MRPFFPDDPAKEDNCLRKMDVCGKGTKATVCDSTLRTYNTEAECGGPEDYYYYSPWRFPGSAPVFDSCGVAGGKQGLGGFGAQYYNTKNAKQGDKGSQVLPKQPSGTTWHAGETVEVSWTIMANHGGGYQYRLCPANSTLDESCFQKNPLPFTGSQKFRWGGKTGTVEEVQGTYVSDGIPAVGRIEGVLHTNIGVIPKGSTWAMNPIPDYGSDRPAPSFKPRCKEIPGCDPTGSGMNTRCRCSGEWGPYDLEIVDNVVVPANLPSGEYVLSWRWDCEESNQGHHSPHPCPLLYLTPNT